MNTHIEFSTTDWQNYAVCYDTLLHLEPYRELLTTVAKTLHLTPADHCLDVGCGTGNLIQRLREDGFLGAITGIDSSSEMLTRASAKCTDSSTKFLQADLNKPLPLASNSYSQAVSINVLYSLADPLCTLQEIHRVLQPAGEIVLVTPRSGFENGLILKAHAKSTLPDAEWQNAHLSPEREKLLIERAFADTELAEQMYRLAIYNRHIVQTRAFHFFTTDELCALCRQSGFKIRQVNSAYAKQAILIHARKENIQ